ncbi:S-adenosyl-L-methionine-dependentmethyltransferases superfamily protein [Striga asiatica]|uniref:S-adenosyl-L-methionine-dependentmethyltransferases superfamily protein n=1 Tax=Striga asiatica TaxID=4170 RepID=A0A5A7QTD0_STRAF|nr:S-adenosyl-L-methionine-dependentmethyltransferases superfamily protein [Striga asiatica]
MSSGSSGGGAAQQSPHSLAFRVMRLCRPTVHVDTSPLKFDPCDLLFGEDLFDDPLAAAGLPRLLSSQSNPSVVDPSDLSYRSRFLLQHPTDSLGLPGLLVLPQSFGDRFLDELCVLGNHFHFSRAIYLGETFCSYISINNSSSFEVRDVVIKAEIQTERQRILLLDTSKSPVESVRAGGRYDFIVEHDVKELGAHTLVCTALYTDGENERKYLPQFFKFVVSNPISVRTKVRNVKDTTFLEACLENHTKSHLYMDQVEFEPAQHWVATVLKAPDNSSDHNPLTRENFKEPILIRPGGGIYNYLYQLKFSPPDGAQMKIEGSKILGKFQITWRTNLGEPGRLQTQHILGNPVSRKEIELHAVEIPPVIILEKSFMTLGEVQAYNSLNFQLNLIAVKLGIQQISGITVFDTIEKKTYDSLLELERTIVEGAKLLVRKSINEHINPRKTTLPFGITDLGCSVGPNTFLTVNSIIEFVKLKYEESDNYTPEFQVYFNDQTANDFNNALQISPSRSRILCERDPGHVLRAPLPELVSPLARFPSIGSRGSRSRFSTKTRVPTTREGRITAREIVSGGLLLLVVLARPDGCPHSEAVSNVVFDALGGCLVDLARKGLIDDEKVNTFNWPIYIASPDELQDVITQKGHFTTIEKMESLPETEASDYEPRAASLSDIDVLLHLNRLPSNPRPLQDVQRHREVLPAVNIRRSKASIHDDHGPRLAAYLGLAQLSWVHVKVIINEEKMYIFV